MAEGVEGESGARGILLAVLGGALSIFGMIFFNSFLGWAILCWITAFFVWACYWDKTSYVTGMIFLAGGLIELFGFSHRLRAFVYVIIGLIAFFAPRMVSVGASPFVTEYRPCYSTEVNSLPV